MKCIHAKLTNGLCISIAWCLVAILTCVAQASDLDSSRVTANTDDCHVNPSTTTMFLNNTSCNFGKGDANSRHAGFRFTDITIPQASIIDTAYWIGFAQGNTAGAVCNLRIYAEDTSSAATFSTYSDFNDRHLTTAYVAWSPGSWTDATYYTSPDIKTVIQEVINRSDWASDNELVIFIRDNLSDPSAYRAAWSMDGDNLKKGILKIYWSAGAPAGATAIKRVGVRK